MDMLKDIDKIKDFENYIQFVLQDTDNTLDNIDTIIEMIQGFDYDLYEFIKDNYILKTNVYKDVEGVKRINYINLINRKEQHIVFKVNFNSIFFTKIK